MLGLRKWLSCFLSKSEDLILDLKNSYKCQVVIVAHL